MTFYCPSPKSERPSATLIAHLNSTMSVERKGMDFVLGAVRIVRRRFPDFVLHVMGPMADDVADWVRRVSADDANEGVAFHGRVEADAKRHLLAQAWVYVQPSRYEGFGMAVVEAMACGTVPVCSAAGSLPEVVGDAGVILPDLSAQALGKAMIGLLEDKSGCETAGAAARLRAKRFDHTTRLEELARTLEDWGVSAGR